MHSQHFTTCSVEEKEEEEDGKEEEAVATPAADTVAIEATLTPALAPSRYIYRIPSLRYRTYRTLTLRTYRMRR